MTPHLKRSSVFVSYSHRDASWLARLRVHLKPLERDYKIDIWDDTRILAGAKWRQEIERALDEAAVAILLVSSEFLASDFIAKNELPPLLQAAEQEGTIILPIILSPCSYKREKGLSDFQAINDPSKPLIGLSKSRQEAVFESVAERVAGLLDALTHKQQPTDRARHSPKARPMIRKRQPQPHKMAVSQPKKRASDTATSINNPFISGRNKKLLLIVPVICLIALAVSIFIITKQSGNRVWSIKPTALAPTYLLTPKDQADAPYRVAVEKGGTARLFDDRLLLRLDALSFDKESGQYFAAFRFSSAKTEDLIVRDAKPSRERFYFYPADGRFIVQLISTNENVAVFSFREKEK